MQIVGNVIKFVLFKTVVTVTTAHRRSYGVHPLPKTEKKFRGHIYRGKL